jgi:hypothetical protein
VRQGKLLRAHLLRLGEAKQQTKGQDNRVVHRSNGHQTTTMEHEHPYLTNYFVHEELNLAAVIAWLLVAVAMIFEIINFLHMGGGLILWCQQSA